MMTSVNESVSPMQTREVFETDWLGSHPVFYHETTGRVSHNVNDVIDYANLEFDADGFNNYLAFGYSVFGQTPIRQVKFLSHSSRLSRRSDGRFHVESLPDPSETWLNRVSTEEEVLHRLRQSVEEWEERVCGEIVIPTSGGYDSRLLNLLITDRSRIRSFSFGLSDKQKESFEVVRARKFCELLGIRWEQIPLGDFHVYFDEWHRLFGISTHAHGMYQIEFHRKIAERVRRGSPLLAGIIGDAWAGSVNLLQIERPEDVRKLGYAHGMNADPSQSRMRTSWEGMQRYFDEQRERLGDPRIRVIEAMRFKILLLSYLITVPGSLGFEAWSPFLLPEVALSMLTLPSERRVGRAWQRDFFAEMGVDIESLNLPCRFDNTLNIQAMCRRPLRPLDARLLGEVVNPDYVRWINRQVSRVGPVWEWIWRQSQLRPRKMGVPLRRLGIQDRRIEAYYAYLTLRPVETLLRDRNACQSAKAWECT
jgi:hypothetical protein